MRWEGTVLKGAVAFPWPIPVERRRREEPTIRPGIFSVLDMKEGVTQDFSLKYQKQNKTDMSNIITLV